jgi:hypothetical protein
MEPASVVVGDAAAALPISTARPLLDLPLADGDLKGVGARYNPVVLQGRMVNPRVVGGGRGVAVPPPPPRPSK